jgi:ribosomal protein S27AE
MTDPLDAGAQPHCPGCGTVLRDDPRGYECGGCGVLMLADGTRIER